MNSHMRASCTRILFSGVSAISICGCFASSAAAQEGGREQANEIRGANEIIVTAQKREENIQDVPLAVTALTGQNLSDRGVVSIQDLQASLPNIQVNRAESGFGAITIRGVGYANLTVGGDPGVAVHLDGHYLQAPTFLTTDFLDVSRVEVLRGPQGTLYGRNAVGGSVNIIANRPTHEFEAIARVGIGNYDFRRFEGVVSGALSSGVRGRVAIADEARDGFVRLTGPTDLTEAEDANYTNVRASLEVDLSDNIEAYIGGYYFDENTGPNSRFGLLTQVDRGTIAGVTDPDGFRKQRDKGAFFDVTWDAGAATITSLTAYNENDREFDFLNLDGNADLALQFEKFETFSQEIRANSNLDGKFNWIAGLYYYSENSNGAFDFLTTDGFVSYSGRTRLNSKSYAAFGQIQYALTDELEVVGGLRYTRDEKAISTAVDFLVGDTVISDGAAVKQSDDWGELTWRVGANWAVTDDALLYVSYSRGYKGGGYNTGSDPAAPAYDPETVDSYEFGIKSDWLDQKLRVNAAFYYYDYSDKQELLASELTPGSGLLILQLENAASASAYGAEFEILARPTRRIAFDAAVGYQKAEYGKFNTFENFAVPPFPVDLTGNELPFSPNLTFHVGLQYEQPIAEFGTITPRLDFSYASESEATPYNRADFMEQIPQFNQINARITWQDIDKTWNIAAYVRNIENKRTVKYLITDGGGESPGYRHATSSLWN